MAETTDITPESTRAAWLSRWCAVACYAGLAPIFRLAPGRNDSFVKHHAAQAAVCWLLLDALILLSLICQAVLSAMIVYARDMYERLPTVRGLAPPQRDSIPVIAALLLWLTAVCIAALLAALGRRRPFPLVGRLVRRAKLLRLAWIANSLSLLFIVVIVAAAVDASRLTRDDNRPAVVYVLYDDLGGVPRWAMNLGFYRVSAAAAERWGANCVVVGRLDHSHLRNALEHGQIIFLACHGADGKILADDFLVEPAAGASHLLDDGPQRGVLATTFRGNAGSSDLLLPGQNLRFVYNAACDGGRKRGAWQRSLYPAEVKTFDRLSLVVEHFDWAWFTAPRLIRGGKWP